MRKSFLALSISILTTTAFAEDTVYYADTTYGPSDNIVHYDDRRDQEQNSLDQTNIPNDEIYPKTEDR